MVCAYLLWSGHPECTDAESAVRFFRERRTSDGHAIHNPSQVRYVRYFASFVGASGPERALRLKGVRIRVTAISISSAPARLLATAADDGGRGASPPVELASPRPVAAPAGIEMAPSPPTEAAAAAKPATGAAAAGAGGGEGSSRLAASVTRLAASLADLASSSWTLQAEAASMRTEVSDATLNDGIATVAAETCTSVPRQCVAGGGPARFDFPGGGLRASGDVRLRLQSVAARGGAAEDLCYLHVHTAYLPPPAAAAASATDGGVEDGEVEVHFGRAACDAACRDPRFAADWRLTLHYVLEDA